jgi:hypothetical protein
MKAEIKIKERQLEKKKLKEVQRRIDELIYVYKERHGMWRVWGRIEECTGCW